MCGRFYVEPEDSYFIELAEKMNGSQLLSLLDGKVPRDSRERYGGEVMPGSVVPVLAPNRAGKTTVFPMRWGFSLQRTGSRRPGLMINARSETAGVKPLFSESWHQRRCIVPASFYFEWEHLTGPDGRKHTGQKYGIRPTGEGRTWLAGLYRLEAGVPSFVILTRQPAADICWIHDRMPLMLPESLTEGWISPDSEPEKYLSDALTETCWEKAE